MNSSTQIPNSIVILCAGGPAPGINTVISSVTKAFLNRGFRVLGLNGGYGPLFKESEATNYIELDYQTAERVQGLGGSMLRMSRYKPKDAEFKADFFKIHNVKLLVTIGGDDTASTAGRVATFLAQENLEVKNIHVPKTIDNDLPLPAGIPTFGYRSALEESCRIVSTINEDSRTTGNWFVISAMGREAGHLAFGIAECLHAPMVIAPEMFSKVECTFDRIIKLMVSTLVKRKILGIDYGSIIISEGVFHFFSEAEIKNSGINFSYDDHGHPELGTISKGEAFNNLFQKKLKELGISAKSRPNDLGYEVRCVKPSAYDLAYCTQLGFAVGTLFDQGKSGCMVTVDNLGKVAPLYLKDVKDPVTGKVTPRLLDFESESVQAVINSILHYLTPADYESAKKWLKSPEEYDFKTILGLKHN
jgi:6-phosphofructokinase